MRQTVSRSLAGAPPARDSPAMKQGVPARPAGVGKSRSSPKARGVRRVVVPAVPEDVRVQRFLFSLFPARDMIASRPGRGSGTTYYMEYHTVASVLNAVIGPDRWDQEVVGLEEHTHEGHVVYKARVKLTIRWADGSVSHREDTGEGSNSAKDTALKASVSDAVKRAARSLGQLAGLCIYDKKFTRGGASAENTALLGEGGIIVCASAAVLPHQLARGMCSLTPAWRLSVYLTAVLLR